MLTSVLVFEPLSTLYQRNIIIVPIIILRVNLSYLEIAQVSGVTVVITRSSMRFVHWIEVGSNFLAFVPQFESFMDVHAMIALVQAVDNTPNLMSTIPSKQSVT